VESIKQRDEEILDGLIRIASGEIWTAAELLVQDDFKFLEKRYFTVRTHG